MADGPYRVTVDAHPARTVGVFGHATAIAPPARTIKVLGHTISEWEQADMDVGLGGGWETGGKVILTSGHGSFSSASWEQGFFLPTAGFLPLGSGKGNYRGYRGIPLNTARIQISNQNR
jgi:hypothetical protein